MTRTHPCEHGLDKNEANFVALSPLRFLGRSASVYPDRIAVIYGSRRQTWRDTDARCRRLASGLKQRGIGVGDTVAVMLPNVPAMFALHFGVPMTGAVLNTLNTQLDAEAISFMVQHAEARMLLIDREFAGVVEKALTMLGDRRPFVIEGEDEVAPAGKSLGDVSYEVFLAHGDPALDWQLPADEWDAIALNSTSGTTGNPKGVVTHHRGAYLNAVCNAVTREMPRHLVYLSTLPMFHCNGWCFPWTLALQVGASVCLRKMDPALIFRLIREHQVSGAPIVYGLLINTPDAQRAGISHALHGLIAGDPATMQPVPADGQAMGENFFRGNLVMKGYLKNATATEEPFAGGWFRTGDLAVVQADG